MSFIEQVIENAKTAKQTIAIPEFKNEYMMKAAVRAHQEGIANIVFVGAKEEVQKAAQEMNYDITGIAIADNTDEEYKTKILDLYDAIPEKLMKRQFVEKRIKNPLYFATVMEAAGEVDGILAGVDTTTLEFVMATSSIIGLDEGVTTASGLIILEFDTFEGVQGNIIGMADGAICLEPTVEQHAGIAIGSCETFEAVTGKEAKCAFLSYSTDGSGGMSEPVKKVRAAVELAKQQRPDLKIDGEFQADAAIIKWVGEKKVKRESEVAGQANVLIFPDASACNIGSKLAQWLSGAKPYGPLYQGFRKPILDCSRSDTDETLFNDIALLSLLAKYKKDKKGE
ncbi:MAG: phosphate acetyltransferase [Parasporobacterium sp.]|nr:phosphate acetyltransferase [Parasporobacterium sp.]